MYKLYSKYVESYTVSTDSRVKSYGGIFFALTGDKFDGHDFVEQAFNNGYEYAVVSNKKYKENPNCFLVENTIESLQNLAKHHIRELNIPVLAITGTNGKTTTKELVYSVLQKKYRVGYTKGNLNNHIGLPLTILSFDKDIELAVIEMGANHQREISLLCDIANPTHGVITNIGKAHLEGFGSYQNVVVAKKELYDYLEVKSGNVYYNKSIDILADITVSIKQNKFAFGTQDSTIPVSIKDHYSDPYLALNIQDGRTSVVIKSKLFGEYNKFNILTAYVFGKVFKIPTQEIINAIEDYTPQNNRSQFLKTEKNELYIDAYNANPTSMSLALEGFGNLDRENKCVIIGDMLELGDYSTDEHQKIYDQLGTYEIHKVFLIGQEFLKLKVHSNIRQFENVEKLKNHLDKYPIEKASILIKGSRGIQLEKVIDHL